MKLKLKPSARIKRRYLLIDGNKEEIEKAILDYIGILGWANSVPMFVQLDPIVLAIERSSLTNVRAAFEASPYKINVKKVSGTLKGLS